MSVYLSVTNTPLCVSCQSDAKITLMHKHTCTTQERGWIGDLGNFNKQAVWTVTFTFVTKNYSDIYRRKLIDIVPEQHVTKGSAYPSWNTSIT